MSRSGVYGNTGRSLFRAWTLTFRDIYRAATMEPMLSSAATIKTYPSDGSTPGSAGPNKIGRRTEAT